MIQEDRINYLNIGLMLITAVFAFFMPFETFLLAYAFLGPLHYLTEISWLHDRQYFTKGKYDFIVLLGIGVLLSVAAFAQDFGYDWEIYQSFAKLNLFDKLIVLALFSSILFALVKNVIIKLICIAFLYVFVSGWLSPERVFENDSSTTVFALTSLVPTLIHVYIFTGLFMLYGALKSRSKSGLWQMIGFVIFPIILVLFLPVNSNNNNLTSYGKNAYYAKGNGFYNTNLSILSHFGFIPNVTNEDYVKYVLYDENYIPDSIKYAFTLEKYYAAKRYTVVGKDSVVRYQIAGNKYSDIMWNDSLSPIGKPTKAALDSLYPKIKAEYIKKQAAPYLEQKNELFRVQNPESPYYMKPIKLSQLLPSNNKQLNYWIYFSTVGIMLMRFIAFAYLYHYLNWFSKTEIIRWHQVPKGRFIAVILLWLVACGFYLYDYSLGLSLLFFLSFTHVLLEFPLNIVSIVGIGKESLSIYKNGFKKE